MANNPAVTATEEPSLDRDAAPESSPLRASGTRFVFMDTEATGLDHDRHELTEVAWIVRFEDGREEERQFFPQHTTDGADADALELTRYADRIAPQTKTPASEWLDQFLEDAKDAVLVGAVPDFDARHLDKMCRKLGREPTWDHHLLDVETLALPLIAPGPEAPRSLAKTCEALGIDHDKDLAHGALYDARQARAVFDRVWELLAELRLKGDPLPPPVPRPVKNGDNGDDDNGDKQSSVEVADAPDHTQQTGHAPDQTQQGGDPPGAGQQVDDAPTGQPANATSSTEA